MKPIPTVAELIYLKVLGNKNPWLSHAQFEEALIEFAQMHVEAALDMASGRAFAKEPVIGYTWEVDNDSILNCYPSTNIK